MKRKPERDQPLPEHQQQAEQGQTGKNNVHQHRPSLEAPSSERKRIWRAAERGAREGTGAAVPCRRAADSAAAPIYQGQPLPEVLCRR